MPHSNIGNLIEACSEALNSSTAAFEAEFDQVLSEDGASTKEQTLFFVNKTCGLIDSQIKHNNEMNRRFGCLKKLAHSICQRLTEGENVQPTETLPSTSRGCFVTGSSMKPHVASTLDDNIDGT